MARRLQILPTKGRLAEELEVTPKLIASFKTCKFQPRIRAGMPYSEANSALDAAVEKFIECLTSKGRKILK